MLSDLSLQGVGMTSERTRERLIARLIEQGIVNIQVLEAMRSTPRHFFVDEALSHRAYEDTALPIGYGQTLSQPYIVARMTELLLASAPKLDNVLEIGTGSGYQTAILAPFTKRLQTVERITRLLEQARNRIRHLGFYHVDFHLSDGTLGLAEHAPYDAILSAAAPTKIPLSLKKQLAPNGVLISPVGDQRQQLIKVTRCGDSAEFVEDVIESVRFVPLLEGTIR